EQDAADAEGREPRLLDAEALLGTANALTRLLLWAADRVQERIVGRVIRMDRSHQEAGRWVYQVATRIQPLDLGWFIGDDRDQVKAWIGSVSEQATVLYGQTMELVGEHL